MKKSLVIAAIVVLASFSKAWAGHFIDVLPPASASGCTPVSNGYDYNCSTDAGAPVLVSSAPVQLLGKTIAQIRTLAPTAAGQVIYCLNCQNSQVCVSSGTGAGAWVATSSGTTTTPQQCI